jgi:tRNA-uridine 2-sulfurtransferase
VLCNAEIKFKAFLDHAMALGAKYIATGHYARKGGRRRPRNAAARRWTATRTRAISCYRLSQAQLAHALFPLGDLPKPEVRALAHEIGLPNAAKKDSTGICFIGERNFREFLERYLPRDPGDMKTPEGRVVGRHQGLMYYTLGQRQGLGIGGQKDGSARALVRRRQGHGQQYPDRGAGPRPSAAAALRPHGGPAQLDQRC